MAFDPKKFRRRFMPALTLALSATLTMSVLAACATTSDDGDEEEEETTTQTDTQTLRNGNFEFYSEMDVEDKADKLDLISSPTSWSFTSGSPTSDTASGIIDTSEWSYLSKAGREFTSVEDAVAHWTDDNVTAYDRLKFYEDFEDEIDDLEDGSEAAELFAEYDYSIDFEDVEYLAELSNAPTPRTGAAEDETGVLMIHNRRTSDNVPGTGQYYTSSTTISLEAGTSAKVSVWVRTDDLTHYRSEDDKELSVLGNAGAYIRVNQTVGGTTLDPVYLENINTQGQWKEYTLYVRASSFTTSSFTIVLGLGQGSTDNRLGYVNGYAFFDDVSCEVLTSAAFDDATGEAQCSIDSEKEEKRFEGNTYASVKIDLDADLGTDGGLDITAGDAAITKDPEGGKSNVVYTGPYADDYAKVTTAAQLAADTANNSYLKNIYDTDLKSTYPFEQGTDDMTVILLMSVSGAPYTAATNEYKLPEHTHMMVSFFVKTSEIGGTGASATVVDGDNRTQIAAFDSTTVDTVDIDDETKDIYDGWVQCFFFISNDTDSEKTFTIEFSYGPTDVASAEKTAYDDGYAAFAGFRVLEDVNAKYIDYASTDSYSVKATLTGAVDNDSAFDTAGVDTARDIRNTLAPTANFTAVPNASKSIVTGGVANELPEGLYTGLLNAKYAGNYVNAASNGEVWASALNTLANNSSFTDDSLSDAEEWWAKIFGDYNQDGSKASSRVANQPLLVLNTSQEAVNAYGYLSDTMTVSADSYQRISLRVKLSAGATATIYLIDTSDVKKGYNDPLAPTLPSVTFRYDDNGNIVGRDPADADFNARTDVVFYRADNGLFYRASGDTSKYYANLKNYTVDEATSDLLAVDESGNTTIAFYAHEGKFYAYREEIGRGEYEYSQEVLDLYDAMTAEEREACVRYDYTALDAAKYASVITVEGTPANAGKWVDVSFYIHTGNTEKDYRLEVWAGSRDYTVSEDGTVTPTGKQIPAGGYVFFDNYTSTDVSENYDALLTEAVDDLKKAHDVATDEDLPEEYALYYTYTFYDAKDFLRYDKSLDEDELGDPYGSYAQSAYSEGIAWLKADGADEKALYLDYALSDVTVEADDLTSDDDTTEEEDTTNGDTNVWLIISSGVLAFALVFAVVAIIVRRLHKKFAKKHAKVRPARTARAKQKPQPTVKEEPEQAPEAPKDENDPYNE